jgi:sec-independent protein translocase protein TatB
MDIFGIGPLNIIVILGVMLIVFGPERLPEMAARAGKMVRDLRSYASDVTGEFGGEFAEIQQHLTGVQDDVRALGREFQQTSAELGASVREATAGAAGKSASDVAGVNDPPPRAAASDNVLPLTNAPLRARVDDYKPGS